MTITVCRVYLDLHGTAVLVQSYGCCSILHTYVKLKPQGSPIHLPSGQRGN